MNNNFNFDSLEVLAPAGGSESFFAALNAGADAIYLGLSDFNARMKAENFNTQNIREFVKIAHTFGVKIYVTINTLLETEEFDKLVSLVGHLVEAKVDAFIVQDFGVAHILKTCFENIVLHASTQMGIHNLEGALIAQKLGFSRIVLARETKLEDIKEIKQKTNLEIEYFVQGALCIAFSGNCYLSALEKNQSGNSGRCLQLCRLPYRTNKNSSPAYLLSARDLSLLENLQLLIEAGVTSFKIEGRMRHAGYVSTATSIYREAIKKIKNNKKFSSEWLKEKNNELKISFSRGDFNKRAYLDAGTPDNIVNQDYQNHIGQKIGKVLSVVPFKNNLFKIDIYSDTKINAGDGLKFVDSDKKLQVGSVGVGNVETVGKNKFIIYSKTKIKSNIDVFLTQSAENEQKLLKNKRKIAINLNISAKSGQKLKILCQTNNISTELISDFVLQKAENKPLERIDFEMQFKKLNDTVFELNSISVETDGVFVPKSLLNETRRQMIDLLQKALIEANEKHIIAKQTNIYEKIAKKCNLLPKNIVIFDNLCQVNKNITDVIWVYAPSNYSLSDIQNMQNELGENLALNLPVILNYEDKKYLNNIIQSLQTKPILFANNIYGLWFAQNGYEVIASPLLNIKNNYAINCISLLNVKTICASIESTTSFADKNSIVWFSSGDFPVMTFAHCPYKTVYKNTCKTCKFDNNLQYFADFGKTYNIKRTKLTHCQFSMNCNLNRDFGKFNLKNLTQ